MDGQANHVTGKRRLGAFDRILRHPIRSTILGAIACALATIALVLASSGNNSALAASSLVNGNFETGDLTGWSVDTTDGGGASVVASYDNCLATRENNPTCSWGWPISMPPQEGSYLAVLTPGKESEDTIISQTFEASSGDKVSGWAFFHSHDYPPYADLGKVVITNRDSGTTVTTPVLVSAGSVGEYNITSWFPWEYTFTGITGTGTFQIEARIHNTGDSQGHSAMGLDDVKITKANPDATKPSTSATRSVEPNEAGWNKENVTVKLNATDNQGGSGVQKITYSASGAQTIAPTDASGDSVEVALDQEGTTTLTYYATDKAGNVEDQKSLTLKIDKSAPTGSVSINDGASSTRIRSVTLSLNATDPSPGGSGVSQMRISNTESGLSSASWEAYSTTKEVWPLSSGKGTKTVYVQYRDGAGNDSAVATDTITIAR